MGILSFSFNNTFLLSLSFSNFDIDKQGFLSLAFVIGSITVFSFVRKKSLNDLVELLKKVDFNYGLVLLFLAGITFVGFWLTARLIGFYFYKYLFKDGFIYIQYQIFEMLSYFLATRLCLTLFDTIKKDALPENDEESPLIKMGYIDTLIQAVVIGILTVLPNYGNSKVLNYFGTTQDSKFLGFLFLLMTLVVILMLLLYARKKLTIPDNSHSDNNLS